MSDCFGGDGKADDGNRGGGSGELLLVLAFSPHPKPRERAIFPEDAWGKRLD